MNVEQCQAAAEPQTKPTDLDCESACRLLTAIAMYDVYHYVSVLWHCWMGIGKGHPSCEKYCHINLKGVLADYWQTRKQPLIWLCM